VHVSATETPAAADGCAAPTPDNFAMWEPDESCPDLAAIVGDEAIATFERDRALRAQLEATTDDTSGVMYSVVERTIYGYIRDQASQPIAGVRVRALDADDLDDDDFMGEVTTSSTGYFEIHYDGGHWDPCPHEWDCWRPDIYVQVLSRQWVNYGKVYAGPWDGMRPKCSSLEYEWRLVDQSNEHSDWRLRDALRIDVVTEPRDEIWEDASDRPPCLMNDTFCYSFTSVHSQCLGFVERLQGCTEAGQQFEWFDACLFVSPTSDTGLGYNDSYASGYISRCFGEPLPWPPGVCTDGASLQPADPQASFLTTTAVDD
jgi:hypothetical protein